MKDKNLEGKRAALYIRVSTEEQALRGYSLEAQLEDLEKFAKENYMIIVDRYIDAGTTARKKLKNRKEFQRMIEDVKAGEIDVILFIKLDRWFRNVADYYEIQKIIDAHNVTWKCTQEFYDTTTANGRLNLNIKLSIAQDESDRTSERIKFVQQNKVKNGEVISGSLPYGLRIAKKEGRKVVEIDEEKIKVVEDAFNFFLSCHSRRKTRLHIIDTYGVRWTDQTFKSMIYNDLYAGEYRGNDHYCPAAFEKEKLTEMRRICETLHQHSRSGVHIYIFSGILRCEKCGNIMHGVSDPLKDGGYTRYYRCSKRYNDHACTNSANVKESAIEEFLLNNLKREIKSLIVDCEVLKKESRKPQRERQKIKAKMKKLKDLYLNDLIDLNEYKKDYEEYQKALNNIVEVEPQKANIERLERLLNKDIGKVYESLDRPHKRLFWRSIIKEIYVDERKEIKKLVFL